MAHSSTHVPPILDLMSYEIKPAVVQNYERQYQHVCSLTANWTKAEREIVEILHTMTLNNEDYTGMHIGLYYTVLVDKEAHNRAFLAMLANSRDNLGVVITEMNRTLGEFWPKLLLQCKKQLLWLFCELVAHNQHAETVVNHLCKRMSNGDLSSVNIWLIEYMVSFFSAPANLRWLEQRAGANWTVIALLAFTFLRLIPDHFPSRSGAGNEMSHAEQQRLVDLRNKEIKFTSGLLRTHWRQCSVIGRELVRVLMDVAQIPEFHSIWTDLLHRPRNIPGCKGLKALMKSHSNTAIIAHSVAHDAEQWLKFLIRSVKLTSCNYYLEWFQRRFLSTPESQSLRPLLIRFLVVNVHSRATEAVQAELIGRHQVVLWLVANCTPVTLVASCRLAIFFDWLLGEGNRYDEVIRLFEPGMFIILRCPSVNTGPLISFLIDIIHEFHPPFTAEMRASVVRVMQLVRSRFSEDLTPLFKHSELDPVERQRVEHEFVELLMPPNPRLGAITAPGAIPSSSAAVPLAAGSTAQTPPAQQQQQQPQSSQQPPPLLPGMPASKAQLAITEGAANRNFRPGPATAVERAAAQQAAIAGANSGRNRTPSEAAHPSSSVAPPTPPVDYPEMVPDGPPDHQAPTSSMAVRRGERQNSVCSAKFSDEGDTAIGISTIDDLRRAFTNYKIRFIYRYRDVDVDAALENLEDRYREHLRNLQRAVADCTHQVEANETQVSTIDALVDSVTQVEIGDAALHTVAAVLCQLYLPAFESKLLPHNPDDDSLMNSYSAPIFQVFRYMIPSAELPELDPGICMLLAHMHSCQPRVGYFLLYCLKLSSTHAPISDWNAIYCQFVESLNHLPSEHQLEWTESGGVGQVLLKHMEIVASDDPDLLVFLLPDVVEQFPKHTRNNSDFIRLIVSTVDCKQIRDLVCQVLQGHLQLLDGAEFHNCLVDSLSWESIEQIFLWQLLNAHEIPTECFLPFLARLNHNDHAEALFNLLLMFKLEKPNDELLKAVLDRDVVDRDHFSVSILHFWADRDQERLAGLLDRFITDKFRDRKRVKPGKAKEFPPLERILAHLDHMRVVCKKNDILQSGTLQAALQTVNSNGGVTDELRSRFMDLFALALEPDLATTNVSGGGPAMSGSASGGGGSGGGSGSGMGSMSSGAAEADRPRNLRNVAARKAAEAQRRQEFGSASAGGGGSGGGGASGHSKERRKTSAPSAAEKGHAEKKSDSDSGSDDEVAPPRSKKRRAAPTASGMLSQLSNDIFDDEA